MVVFRVMAFIRWDLGTRAGIKATRAGWSKVATAPDPMVIT